MSAASGALDGMPFLNKVGGRKKKEGKEANFEERLIKTLSPRREIGLYLI